MSETWQQSSDRRIDAEAVDPENRLFARMNRTRLDFEAQRDAVLAVAGRLDPTVGGKSVDVTTDTESPTTHDLCPHRPSEFSRPVSHIRYGQSGYARRPDDFRRPSRSRRCFS